MTEAMRIDPADKAYLDKLPPCKNCGESIHEHQANSEPPWMCPPECQPGSVYGFFTGGDPRTFHPDAGECSPEELKRHREACEAADKLEANRDLPCPSGWEWRGDSLFHFLRAPFGIGVQVYPPMCYEMDLGEKEAQP